MYLDCPPPPDSPLPNRKGALRKARETSHAASLMRDEVWRLPRKDTRGKITEGLEGSGGFRR